jgi:hypothetical protein
MLWMWADRFDEIWRDSFEFFNFTTTTIAGLAILTLLLLFGRH